MACPAPSSRRKKRKCARHVKVTHAPWKKEIGVCVWTRSENATERSGMRGAAAEEEVEGAVEVAGEEASMMIAAGAPETVAGAVGAE